MLLDALHLFYPDVCLGCANELYNRDAILCIDCILNLPHTGYASHPGNPVENIFRGRIDIKATHSEFYFSKSQLIQHLIHQLKYKDNIDIGFYLGEQLGNTLLTSGRFSNIDYLIPLPLYADKEL